MTVKFPAAKTFAKLLSAIAVVAVALGASQADAAKRKYKYDERGRPYYSGSGPNVSYQAGPRTRVYVTKRSWLDAGVEVRPGDRKFTDYAFPPGPSFGVQNVNRSTERQPLNTPSDLGGSPERFPLY